MFDTTINPGFIDIHRGFLGDTNDDGTVNLTDLTAVALHWRAHDNLLVDGDLNNDGTIDLTDLTEVALHWRALIGTGAFGAAADSIPGASSDFLAAVNSLDFGSGFPEPASLTLLGLGAVGLLARRRRNRSQAR